MKHMDERMVPLKMELLETVPMSLTEGYYIDGKLETFAKTNLFNEQFHVFIPDSFVEMPTLVKKLKYPSAFRPEIIKTNLDCSVNLTFGIIDNPHNLTGKEAAKSFRSVLARTNPAMTFQNSYTERSGEGLEVTCFDFVSFGVDEHIYNIICLISVHGSLLQVGFNCLERDMYKWKEAVKEIFLSIEVDSVHT